MTDRLGHLPVARVDACLITLQLLYHHLRLHMDHYGYVSTCLSLWIVIELDHYQDFSLGFSFLGICFD